MPLGVIGRKLGMTRVFSEEGVTVPVTVLEVIANRVTQVKEEGKDGYRAVQVTAGSRRPSRVNKPRAGIFAKAGVAPGRGLWEFRLAPGEGADLKPGADVRVDIFEVGQKVDVQGTTIGKGYTGVMKRHGFRGGRASHGASLSHRSPGSIGQRTTPGRVFPGKKMSGHMGAVRRTQQNLEVVSIDTERNLLMVKGAVPGSTGGDVVILPAVKVRAGTGKEKRA